MSDTATNTRDWPALPDILRRGFAYGVLEVRAGVWDDDPDIMGADVGSVQEGDVRHRMLARVKVRDGSVLTEEHLPRDGYDWGVDTIVFLPYCSDMEIECEEGYTCDICMGEDEAIEANRLWKAFLANSERDDMEARTGPAGGEKRAGPRL